MRCMGRIDIPDPNDYRASLGWHGTYSARARRRSPRSAGGGVGKKYLTTPALSEMQLRVFRLGLLQDGDVGIGVFPEVEEILISSLGFGGIARDGIGAGQLKTGERAEQEVPHKSGMISELLDLGSRSGTVPLGEVSQAANVHGIDCNSRRRGSEFVG